MSERTNVERVTRRMGEPSWLILATLSPTHPIHRYGIITKIEELYRETEYPISSVDPATITYALRRMVEDNVATIADNAEVLLPTRRGYKRKEVQPRYLRTELGEFIFDARRKLYLRTLNLERH